jgi:hypothetical protein
VVLSLFVKNLIAMLAYFTWFLVANAIQVLGGKIKTSYNNASSAGGNPQVTIAQGIVVGTTQDGNYPVPVEAFMGLPYARPPTGDLRFRRAEPLPSSNTTIIAQNYGSMYVTIEAAIQSIR